MHKFLINNFSGSVGSSLVQIVSLSLKPSLEPVSLLNATNNKFNNILEGFKTLWIISICKWMYISIHYIAYNFSIYKRFRPLVFKFLITIITKLSINHWNFSIKFFMNNEKIEIKNIYLGPPLIFKVIIEMLCLWSP